MCCDMMGIRCRWWTGDYVDIYCISLFCMFHLGPFSEYAVICFNQEWDREMIKQPTTHMYGWKMYLVSVGSSSTEIKICAMTSN